VGGESAVSISSSLFQPEADPSFGGKEKVPGSIPGGRIIEK